MRSEAFSESGGQNQIVQMFVFRAKVAGNDNKLCRDKACHVVFLALGSVSVVVVSHSFRFA